MMLPWLWPLVLVFMTAQARPMRDAPDEGCSPDVTPGQSRVTITCQGVDPQVVQTLNAVLDTQDLDLHSKVHQAAAWMRTYHAVFQRLAEGAGEDAVLRDVHALVQAGKLADASALLDGVLASPGEANPERVAAYHFSRADVFVLHFQLREALPHYAAAARMHATHPQYTYRYAVVLQQQRQYPEAEPLYRATLRTLRPLVSADPTTYVPVVAMVLDSLASLYHVMQRLPEAEATYQEALTTYRQLAQTQPTTYLSDVATMLHNVGNLYSSTRRFPEAEAAYQEALALYRQLTQAHPAAYLPEIATALTNLAVLYNHVNRLPEAEAAYQEALTLRRQLAQGNPAVYLPGIATTLYNIGGLYMSARRPSEAEATFQDALTVQRQLAQTNPPAYLPDVAATLHTLAVLALAQSRPQDAAAWIGEAVTIRRTLWQHAPGTQYAPWAHGNALAQSLALEAETLTRTGAATSVVCTRLHEATRVAADAGLRQLVSQRMQAWCGEIGGPVQR